MGIHNIEKTPLHYRLLYAVAHVFFRLFYRKFIIKHRENIPYGKQIIFASNHQNALMDALALLFAAGRPVAFLARADMFKKTFFARLLYFVKILPVYRPRDGAENMNQNYEVFEHTARILRHGTPIAILPEGTHSPIKKLQQLKKGICRIAFLTAESQNFREDIHIVPVGIDYTHYSRAGTDLLLIYGKPISVAEYYPLYRENPQRAITQLIIRLAEAIKGLMIHVENADYYTTYQKLLRIAVPKSPRYASFIASRDLIARIDAAAKADPELLPDLRQKCNAYFAQLRTYGFRDAQVKKPVSLGIWFLRAIGSLLLLPLHIAGALFNYLPYKIPVLLARKAKDKQFVSSLNYGFGLVLFLIWYLVAGIAIGIISKSILITFLALVVAALLGLLSFYHYLSIKKLIGAFRLNLLRRRLPAKYVELKNMRNDILETINTR